MAADPESSNSGIPCLPGFRVRAHSASQTRVNALTGAPRNDDGGFFNSLLALVLKAAGGSQAKKHKMTKVFDWKRFSEVHKPEWTAWLETNHAKPVTEAEYMAAYRIQRIIDTRPNKSRRYSTSKLRGNYRKLRNDFGFFV
jgi:hypothetical protein